MATLPDPTFELPRAKPVPEERVLTKWEEYAASKGITKRKRSRMVFDEASQEYKPRYGYKSANNEEPPWIVLSDQTNPYEDQFEKRAEAKKERIEKNTKRHLRNLERKDEKRLVSFRAMV